MWPPLDSSVIVYGPLVTRMSRRHDVTISTLCLRKWIRVQLVNVHPLILKLCNQSWQNYDQVIRIIWSCRVPLPPALVRSSYFNDIKVGRTRYSRSDWCRIVIRQICIRFGTAYESSPGLTWRKRKTEKTHRRSHMAERVRSGPFLPAVRT